MQTHTDTVFPRRNQVMVQQPIPTCEVAIENNFFHNHSLHIHFLQPRDHISCKVCHKYIGGEAYGCDKLLCKFYIHTTCFELPTTIRHPSHSTASLTLYTRFPYKTGAFICHACGGNGDSFHYHSSDNFDLHIECAALPASVIVKPSKTLMLQYSFPIRVDRGPSGTKCNMCSYKFSNTNCWVYYHENSRFISHLICALTGNGTSATDIQQRLNTMVPILPSSSSSRSLLSRIFKL